MANFKVRIRSVGWHALLVWSLALGVATPTVSSSAAEGESQMAEFNIMPVRSLSESLGAPLWTPSQEQARRAMAALKTFLASDAAASGDARLSDAARYFRNEDRKSVYQRFSKYRFQFAGVRAPEQKILINAYCDDQAPDKWVIVSDGGDCYFHAVYDFPNDSIVEFGANGQA